MARSSSGSARLRGGGPSRHAGSWTSEKDAAHDSGGLPRVGGRVRVRIQEWQMEAQKGAKKE